MEGLGACSLRGGREHTRPGFRSRDRTPATARPWGLHGTQSGRTRSAAGVNHVAACGFTSGLPVAAGRQCLPRPVTSERAVRAGPVADMPCIWNNGRGGAVDGRQPSLPVGATAVIPGLQRGRGHPLSGAVAASRTCFPCSAVWGVQRQLLLPVPSIILAGSPPVSGCAAGPLRCGSWGRRIPG